MTTKSMKKPPSPEASPNTKAKLDAATSRTMPKKSFSQHLSTYLRGMHPRESMLVFILFGFAISMMRPDLFASAADKGVPGATSLHELFLFFNHLWASTVMHYGIIAFATGAFYVWTSMLYWGQGLAYALLDFALRYPNSRLGKFAFEHKIQDNRIIPLSDWIKCAKRITFNMLFITPPVGFAYTYWQLNQAKALNRCSDTASCDSWAAGMPTVSEFFSHFAFFLAIEEVLFYFSHRLFHWGILYKKFHKIHHEFTAPVGIAATYAHPLEHIISNLTPVLIGPALLGSHPFTTLIWITIAISNTIHTHSGYELWGMPTARIHDFHHYSFIYQFGVLGIFDWLLGTSGGQRWFDYVKKYDDRIAQHKAGLSAGKKATNKAE